MGQRLPPGTVRDAIIATLSRNRNQEKSTSEIIHGVRVLLGEQVASSSVRSYLRLHPDRFDRVSRGHYRLRG